MKKKCCILHGHVFVMQFYSQEVKPRPPARPVDGDDDDDDDDEEEDDDDDDDGSTTTDGTTTTTTTTRILTSKYLLFLL